eukprot:10804783-Lingulodinium_polyedra.AAC.1
MGRARLSRLADGGGHVGRGTVANVVVVARTTGSRTPATTPRVRRPARRAQAFAKRWRGSNSA